MVIAGGGTGGHLFPGIAVAEEFRKRDGQTEIMFIGTDKGIEARVIPREGYTIRFLKAEGVLGKSLFKKLSALFKMLTSVIGARALFNESRPDIVVGTGGYVSVGPVLAARMMSIPTLILEQNLVPGLANRMLARIVDAIAVTYHESLDFLPRMKTRLIGNPIRQGILKGRREDALELFSLESERLTIFISGGSMGASRINHAMIEALNVLLDMRDDVQFLHQTGEKDYEKMRTQYRDMGYHAMVVPFIYQMAEAYAVADLVISRAGATTLAEITALGKPSILVPYPHAGGHQEFNAQKLYEIGGCEVIKDHDLIGVTLAATIRKICRREELRSEMRQHSRALGRPDAAQKAVDMAVSLIRNRTGHV